MSIKFYVPASLSSLAERKEIIEVNGKTVGECLGHLVTLMPKMAEALFYKTGEAPALWSRITVFVNGEAIGAEGLAKEVKDGDEIHIKLKLQ